MDDRTNCRAMEIMCRDRATADPQHGEKWLGQAERWCELARSENSWRLQKRSLQQHQDAGPMTMQSRSADGDKRPKQMA